ncbi:MAG: glycosidase [Ilumatobacteraceae bacterium]
MSVGDHSDLVQDAGIDLQPDPLRTIMRFFVPGNEDVGGTESRAGQVIDRILALSEDEVDRALQDVDARIAGRHPGARAVFEHHASIATRRIDEAHEVGAPRRRLLGAAFTHEFAIEGAALCNPSIVRHPIQPEHGTAFAMSVRGIGEGHHSSIGFRTGLVAEDGTITIDPPGPNPHTGHIGSGIHRRAVMQRALAEAGDALGDSDYVLDPLPARFDDRHLATRIEALAEDADTRRHTPATIARLEHLARSSYRVEFRHSGPLSERVLWPNSPAEHQGMEDARFVEITDGSAPRYCATYTAFDGKHVAQHLITTEDFVTFTVAPMAGIAARGKGLALFPRQIDGKFVALSRHDRETNTIAESDDLHCWDHAASLQEPRRPWEVLQLGNCGSPIETPAGWLVLTHGVGALRTYSIGAILLDLDEPHRMIAACAEPILVPTDPAGYVPNVVYTCGALLVGDRLVLPYGRGDRTIGVATLDLDQLVESMEPT